MESNASVEGRGMVSESDINRGIMSSIASSSAEKAMGDKIGNVRLCSWRV